MQVPGATRVITDPDTVQTPGVSEENSTLKDEDAVAVTVKDPLPTARLASGAKLIVWGSLEAVVEVKVAETPPIVSVVDTDMLANAEAVCRTHTVCPLLIVPAALVKVTPQLME